MTNKKQPTNDYDLLNAADVAKMIGRDIRTVQRIIIAGMLPGARKVTPGKSNSAYIIPRASVEAYIAKKRAQESKHDS